MAGSGAAVRHFLRDDDLSPGEQAQVLELAARLKADRFGHQPLAGPRTVAVLFDKPSLRTRVSFAAGIAELGGFPLVIDSQGTHAGRGESAADLARVLSRQVAAIVWRTFGQDQLAELAAASSVPVINALTDMFHPCQVLADLLTVKEVTTGGIGPSGSGVSPGDAVSPLGNAEVTTGEIGPSGSGVSPGDAVSPLGSAAAGTLAGVTLTFLGDGSSNMAQSYLLGGATAGLHVRICGPQQYGPAPAIAEAARAIAARTGGSVAVGSDPDEACKGASFLATDVWTSMGQEGQEQARETAMTPFRIDAAKLELASPGCGVLHCLPAHRGQEITADVLDGPASLAWVQAENRLHAQKALLTWLIGGPR